MIIGKLIGIDHGMTRIGLATCDAMGIAARELAIITHITDEDDFAAIEAIANRENAVAYVVGIPHNTNAPEGIETQQDIVRQWIARFQQVTDRHLIEWDEYLSSEDARALAREQHRDMKSPIDDLAARVILQRYLDALHDGLATPPPRP